MTEHRMTKNRVGEHRRDDVPRTKMPADVDAPDKVLYGLTFRQLAILAAAGAGLYIAYHALHTLIPLPVLLGAAVVLAGLAFGIAVARRDGQPMDRWLLAAVRHSRAPKALTTTDTTCQVPDWVQPGKQPRVALPAPLKLPADAIADDGQITLPGATTRTTAGTSAGTTAAIVAATTVNLE